jgi:hypothetical protein
VRADRARCHTQEHIFVEYAAKRGELLPRVRWRHVVRDSWFGLGVTLVVVAVIAGFFRPSAAAVFAGCLAALMVGGALWNLASRHTPGCAVKRSVHTVLCVFDYL